jgi:WD40 repeat protein
MGPVQSLTLPSLDAGHNAIYIPKSHPVDGSARLAEAGAATLAEGQSSRKIEQPPLVLVSGSLDNTVKLWDIDSGKVMHTLFGHIEGVWTVACNEMRIVSGSHDRTIKVNTFLLIPVLALPVLTRLPRVSCRSGAVMTGSASLRLSVTRVLSPASPLGKTKSSLGVTTDTYAYGRFLFD